MRLDHKQRGKVMPSDIDIVHFRARLLAMREALQDMRQARISASATVELDQASVGRLSRMDAMQQQAMAKNGKQRAAQTLLRIDAALQRCDAGDYGYCLVCDEPIDPRRLELDPAITLCIRCAETRDSR
jgi:DnaK suppressor protein